MTAETDFRALLAAHAPLVALVGSAIAENVAPQGMPLPLVVFSSSHSIERGLNNAVLADEVTFSVQCWAEDSVTASLVADAVEAALQGAAEADSREGGFNEELQLNAVVLTVPWFVT